MAPVTIRLYDENAYSDVLGPQGLFRYIIWTQGCLRNCKGCMSAMSHSMDGGYVRDADKVINDILCATDIEGITISGGEPFLQAASLVYIVKAVRAIRDVGVTVYTGNSYEELLNSADSDIKEFLECIDLLIDGEYIEELNDDGALRGSSNQRVIPLTNRYGEVLLESAYGKNAVRRAVINIDKGVMSITGVPNKSQYEAFNLISNAISKK